MMESGVNLGEGGIKFNRTEQGTKEVSSVLPKDTTSQDNTTISEIHGMQDLVIQPRTQAAIGKDSSFRRFIGTLGGVNNGLPYPSRLNGQLDDIDSFGPWGMLEVRHNGILRLVDIYHIQRRLEVIFKL
ncbi:hypothetical protein V865_008491 [Kwoniella europaea PYCC6329]|uniref:Uncharacterized protein n=1 Tax=Kwoniella europaea PYCC6329 TaxID=1423913 RepID=A0AAX4KVM0_9TREE